MRAGAPGRALLCLGGVALIAAGCGDSSRQASGDLAWAGKPHVYRDANDRVLTGMVRNTSIQRLEVDARDLRMVDADGDRVPGVATFAAGYLHGLYPPTRVPKEARAAEDRRLGLTVSLAPGARSRLTLAWRQPPGTQRPVRVVYGSTVLPVPGTDG